MVFMAWAWYDRADLSGSNEPALRGRAENAGPVTRSGADKPKPNLKTTSELSLRGLRKQGSIKLGHLDFLAEAEGVNDVEAALEKLNTKFEGLPVLDQPKAILKWASKALPEGKWAQVTSFGLSGLVTLDIAYKTRVLDKMKVLTIDTLHLFPESYELIQKVKVYIFIYIHPTQIHMCTYIIYIFASYLYTIHTYIHTYICIYTYICICTYIHIYVIQDFYDTDQSNSYYCVRPCATSVYGLRPLVSEALRY
jgi:hypothetical protein